MIHITVAREVVWQYLVAQPGSYSGSFDPQHVDARGRNRPEGVVTFCTGRSARLALADAVERFGRML